MAEKKKGKDEEKKESSKKEKEEETEDEVSGPVTAKDAGKGLIILGTVLILIAWFMPFVLGTSDQKIWSLGSEILLFGVVGIVVIGVGLVLLNFERLSRKL